MLKITIPATEYFNEKTQEFCYIKEQTLSLEHSLVSISKWESKWNKPFISKDPMTLEETIDYIKCMTITQNVNPLVYQSITQEIMEEIQKYIELPMTATWFSDNGRDTNREVITSEIIYYWMIALNIPFECQKWHINRLLTLIKVCNIKNAPPKKMSKREILDRNRRLNAMRKKRMHTKG